MHIPYNWADLLILPAMLISLVAGLKLVSNYRNPISRSGGVFLIALSVELSGYFLLSNQLVPQYGRFQSVLQVAGYLCLDSSFLAFVIYFSGQAKRINTPTMALLILIPVITFVFFLMNWADIPVSITGNLAGLGMNIQNDHITIGPFEGLFIGYSYFVGTYTLLLQFTLLSNTLPRQRPTVLGLLAGTFMITIAGIMELIRLNPMQHESILQIALALTSVPALMVIFSWKAAGIMPLQQQLFKDAMRDGYVIFDADQRVVDFNPVVKTILGGRVNIEAGQPARELFPGLDLSTHPDEQPGSDGAGLFQGADFIYRMHVHPIVFGGHDRPGMMVVFRNLSDLDQMEDAVRSKNAELLRSNRLLSSLTRVSVSMQSAMEPGRVLELLGEEMHRLGLTGFVLLVEAQTGDLVVSYFSGGAREHKVLEKFLGARVAGYHLDRVHFAPLYRVVQSGQVKFQPKNDNSLTAWIAEYPEWLEALLRNPLFSREQEASMLVPLIADKVVTGLMGVWGPDLDEMDVPGLRLFGDQVGWAIEKARLQKIEAGRVEELSHANALTTTLARISSQIESTPNLDAAFETLSRELEKIHLSSAIITVDEQRQNATIRYITFTSDVLEMIERLAGIKLVGHQIPRRLWPGNRVVELGEQVWYGDPGDVLTGVFSYLPDSLVHKIRILLAGKLNGQVCVQPLRVQGRVIGVMPIWGAELSPRDAATLSIFGDQVAGFMDRSASFEKEIEKSNALSRSNRIILALSRVAARLDTTSDLQQVFQTLGEELGKSGMKCMIGTLDDEKQYMKIEYLSMSPDVVRQVEKINPLWPKEIVIPRRLWPTETAVTDKIPFWDTDFVSSIARMVPVVSRSLLIKVFELAGIHEDDHMCYLPLISEEDVIGILGVWGSRLEEDDLPTLGVFASQVATAIVNTKLYNLAQTEIEERRQAEQRIQSALNEKEVLLKEIHHRVKNNLQVISSLLNLQMSQTEDENTVTVLMESQNRVRAMALIHEKLYQSSDLAQIDFTGYLKSLAGSLAQTYRTTTGNVEVRVQGDPVELDIDTAVPCGLIVNELVTNSLKHAFPGGRAGCIEIACRAEPGGAYRLQIGDNGVGLPPGYDPRQASSLGLKLVTGLVRQIGGGMSVDGSHGTRFEIRFSTAV